MLFKKNIKELDNIFATLINSSNNRQLINNSIQKVNDIASHTHNSAFISVVGHAYLNDNLIIENDSNSDTPLYMAYTDCGNTKLGIATNNQVAKVISNIIDYARNLYQQHRINLIAQSVNKTNTKRGRKNLLAFFVGNEYGIEKEQRDANLHGTKDFELYMQQGTSQALEDAEYIKNVKNHNYLDVPSPLSLINDTNAIVKNIALGKKIMKNEKVAD